MANDQTRPQRRRPAHPPPRERFNQPTILFVTVCTNQRRPVLAEPGIVERLRSAWQQADHWQVGRWVAMPDHVHFFCGPAGHPPAPLGPWIRYWKSLTSHGWAGGPPGGLWQTGFWDTQLRRGGNYDAWWDYVRMNPVRAGLCRHPDDWPHQGEEHILDWIS